MKLVGVLALVCVFVPLTEQWLPLYTQPEQVHIALGGK